MGKESQQLSKRGEFKVFQELLSRQSTVYIPLFDVEGIDCIIKTPRGTHVDIQVKTRKSKLLWDTPIFRPRKDFFIICYIENAETMWVLPSPVYKRHSRIVKYSNGKEYFRFTLPTRKMNRIKFIQYENKDGFDRLFKL